MSALPIIPRMKAVQLGAKTLWRARYAMRPLTEAMVNYPGEYGDSPPLTLSECRGERELFLATEYSVCNYRCPYCFIGWAPEDRKAWDAQDVFPKIVHRISRFKHRIKLNLENMGEWFTSRELIDAARFLTRRENVIWVSITTNASMLERMFEFLDQIDVGKVAFTCTYHPTEISLDQFFENVTALHQRGAHLILTTVCFPGNLEHCEELKRRAEQMGVYFRMTLEDRMWREAEPVSTQTATRLYNLLEDRFRWDAQRHGTILDLNHTLGDRCTAGQDYLWINSYGDLFACSSAAAMSTGTRDNQEDCFGNIFELESDYLPTRTEELICPFAGCSCPKDILRRSVFRETFRISERSRHEVYFKNESDRQTLLAQPPVTRLT